MNSSQENCRTSNGMVTLTFCPLLMFPDRNTFSQPWKNILCSFRINSRNCPVRHEYWPWLLLLLLRRNLSSVLCCKNYLWSYHHQDNTYSACELFDWSSCSEEFDLNYYVMLSYTSLSQIIRFLRYCIIIGCTFVIKLEHSLQLSQRILHC